MNKDNDFYLIIGWLNAFFGTMFSQPVLSAMAYIFSILGSIVYIYISIHKHINNKNDEETID